MILADGETPESLSNTARSSRSRLADNEGGRLGQTADLGCWRLPRTTRPPAVLDSTAVLNGRQNLN